MRAAGAAALFNLMAWISPPADPLLRACPFHWITGKLCPLCGVTRGVFALAKGHWAEAIHFNALAPLAFVLLFSLFWKTAWRPRLWQFALAAFAVYGLWRLLA